MKLSEILTEAKARLRREGRVSSRALKVEFALDEEPLGILKEEPIEAQELAVEKDGKMPV